MHAATKNVDLDGNAANGAESQCDLNVLQTFPVKIESKITNRTAGDAFTFSWPSAGPGGFTSSVTPGSTGGVGAKWTWTTNQTVYSYTGSTCANDLCLTQTGGPDPLPKACSVACLADSTSVAVAKGATAGTVTLNWVGGQSTFTVYRSTNKVGMTDPANAIGMTDALTFTDTPPAGSTVYYLVRGVDCLTRKACSTDGDCSVPGDGTCISRGPFGVPGRSLLATDVTVSSASLTSSLITFFSPPKEVFRATSTANSGGFSETTDNPGPSTLVVTIPAYPPGCCPANPDVPHQLRCGEVCVDYLNDPNNCGACGSVCGEGTCCSDGACVSVCEEGWTWSSELQQCVDFQTDPDHCGAYGNACDAGTCCSSAECGSLCQPDWTWCDARQECVDRQNDSNNCGTCGNVCGDGTCCNEGVCATVCEPGWTWSSELHECVDFQNDPNHCGAYNNVCGDGTCCSDGACASVCQPGWTWSSELQECVDFQNDPNHCGAYNNVCGDGTCCSDGACASVCQPGWTWSNELQQCADFRSDSDHCGAYGNACAAGTCCNDSVCASVCQPGWTWSNELQQCADFQNDPNHCGAYNNVCGEGTCCSNGACASVCEPGWTWSSELQECVDFRSDPNHCGSYNNVCGEGTCCSNGECASVCPAGWSWCDGQCVDFLSDPTSCGACGNVCGSDECCKGGKCESVCPAGRTLCDGVCVDLQNDPHNCGACGNVCGRHDDPECEHGHCEHYDVHNPLSDLPPTSPTCSGQTTPIGGSCPNPTQTDPAAGSCPNPTQTDPAAGICPNENPTHPASGYCPNPTQTDPAAGSCPNPTQTDPTAGSCPNETPTDPTAGSCPSTETHPSSGSCPEPGMSPTMFDDTPTCVVNPSTRTIPPGESSTICNSGGVLFKEVPTSITVCGDGIPGVDGTCNGGTTKGTIGTFNRLVPDTSKTVGNAYITPYAVHITSDTSNDGMLEPGETASLVIDVLNAGPLDISQASATLSLPALDLSQDGLDNPVGIPVSGGAASYGTIPGTPVSTNCVAPTLHPASNATVFPISVPASHPGDTSHPGTLAFTGTVNGAPFTMNVPITLGVADRCDPVANTRDFDGVDGLSSPMTKLVPAGDTVPFPSNSFNPGSTRLLKLRMSCGGVNLTDATVDPPEIVGLSVVRPDGRKETLNIHALNLNADNSNNPNDPFFRFNNALSGGQWAYSMRTSLIGTGRFTLSIQIAGRKEYVTGFVLQ